MIFNSDYQVSLTLKTFMSNSDLYELLTVKSASLTVKSASLTVKKFPLLFPVSEGLHISSLTRQYFTCG